MKKIQIIESHTTFAVRHLVLRSGKPQESCRFEGDDFTTTTHFGLFFNEKLIGVSSVFKNKNSLFHVENQFQIRGMAVLQEFQKKNFGKELMNRCEAYCTDKNADLIWFNARENAVQFYEKLGYQKVGDSFSIAEIGVHFVMKKEIIVKK